MLPLVARFRGRCEWQGIQLAYGMVLLEFRRKRDNLMSKEGKILGSCISW